MWFTLTVERLMFSGTIGKPWRRRPRGVASLLYPSTSSLTSLVSRSIQLD